MEKVKWVIIPPSYEALVKVDTFFILHFTLVFLRPSGLNTITFYFHLFLRPYAD